MYAYTRPNVNTSDVHDRLHSNHDPNHSHDHDCPRVCCSYCADTARPNCDPSPGVCVLDSFLVV